MKDLYTPIIPLGQITIRLNKIWTISLQTTGFVSGLEFKKY